MLPLSSVPYFSSSSLSSLLLSSNICIASLMDCTPSSISLLLPITAVSSAKRERPQYTSSALLLKVSLFWPGMKLPGTHLQCTPSVSSWFLLLSFIFCSAILMTAWWKMLKSTGDVGQPSLSPLSGINGSLFPSLPLTRYSVVSCMSTMVSIKSPRRPYLRIPHSARLGSPRGRLSSGRAAGPLGPPPIPFLLALQSASLPQVHHVQLDSDKHLGGVS